MNDRHNLSPPTVVHAIQQDTTASGFTMASEPQTGSLLRTLAATKPAGVFLELGTGTGLCTAWILDGMDRQSALTTVDNDEAVLNIAKHHLGDDPRVTFHLSYGTRFLETLRGHTQLQQLSYIALPLDWTDWPRRISPNLDPYHPRPENRTRGLHATALCRGK